jgi:hypothetical protein
VYARIRTLCNVLVFLVLTFEDELCFERKWETPWRFFYVILSAKLPVVRLWVLDGLVIGMLFLIRNQKGTRVGRVKQLDRMCWISIASLVLWGLYGYLRGGNAVQMRLQIHTHVITMLTAMLFTGVYRRVEDFMVLGKIIVSAALFRAATAYAFIRLVLRAKGLVAEYVLDHGDTLLFVTAFILVVADAVHSRKRVKLWRTLGVIGVMLWAIQVNNRRLAWVSLLLALPIIYYLSTQGSARKRLHRTIGVLIPVITIYVGVGWGRTERIFKPLFSLQQMGGEQKDLSAESRVLENLGLAKTLSSAPLLGTGFGHEYIEISDVLAPKEVFPMYKYDPHNSLLGLAAFMGGIGFYGVWLIFPMTAYYGARAYRFAISAPERTIAVCAVAEVIIHANQMFGDIGIGATEGQVLLPIAIAAASRLAVLTGATGIPRPEGPQAPQGPVKVEVDVQNRAVGTRNVAWPNASNV